MPGLNPKGRPRTGLALAEMIREVAAQPGVMRDLVLRMYDIAMGRSVCIDGEWQRQCAEARRAGEMPPPEPPNGERMQPTIADQQRAWDVLFKFGGFTPPTQVEISQGQSPIDFSRLAPSELDAMERSLAKAAGYEELPAPALEVHEAEGRPTLVLDILSVPDAKPEPDPDER